MPRHASMQVTTNQALPARFGESVSESSLKSGVSQRWMYRMPCRSYPRLDGPGGVILRACIDEIGQEWGRPWSDDLAVCGMSQHLHLANIRAIGAGICWELN